MLETTSPISLDSRDCRKGYLMARVARRARLLLSDDGAHEMKTFALADRTKRHKLTASNSLDRDNARGEDRPA